MDALQLQVQGNEGWQEQQPTSEGNHKKDVLYQQIHHDMQSAECRVQSEGSLTGEFETMFRVLLP